MDPIYHTFNISLQDQPLRHMLRDQFKGLILPIKTFPEYVYDGDTMDICMINNKKIISESLRIKGYDSPEMKTIYILRYEYFINYCFIIWFIQTSIHN